MDDPRYHRFDSLAPLVAKIEAYVADLGVRPEAARVRVLVCVGEAGDHHGQRRPELALILDLEAPPTGTDAVPA